MAQPIHRPAAAEVIHMSDVAARTGHPSVTDRRARAFAECRSLGHAWRHRGAIGSDDQHDTFRRPFGISTGMVGLMSACTNCHTERVRWVTRSGEVVTRYAHPDGYSRHGDEILTAREWRATYVASIFDEFAPMPAAVRASS